jgi:hypothetical protein
MSVDEQIEITQGVSIMMPTVIVRAHVRSDVQVHRDRQRERSDSCHFRLVAVYVADRSGLRLVHFQSVSLPD